MTGVFSSFVDELEARTRIGDCLLAFCRGVDRADWELAASAFHADAVDSHGWFTGNAAAGLVPALRERHAGLTHAAHVVTNVAITFVTPTLASVESYAQVFQAEPGPDGTGATTQRVHAIARYVDRFECRDGVWRIASRSLVYGDLHDLSDTRVLSLPDSFVVQRRDGYDPIEVQEAELGLPLTGTTRRR